MMKYKKYVLPLLATAVLQNGCTMYQVVDRDFEKEELEYIKKNGLPAVLDPLYGAPTGSVIETANEDGVRITIARGNDELHPITKDKLQQWYAIMHNQNDEPKCVAVKWKLMEFDMITDHSTYVYVKPHETIMDLAKFKQRAWDLDGVTMVLPASGYVEQLLVVDPTEKNDCEFADEEVVDSDIVDK